MSRLFGIPTGQLTLALVALLVVALSVVLVLGLRNPIFLRLGVRNVRRRRARSLLIVAGLMLGTAIIAAALATGDTMSQTIRSSATSALGSTDEVVAAKGVEEALAAQSGGTGSRYFPQAYGDRIAAAARPSGLVDGVAPVIVEQIAVVDTRAGRTSRVSRSSRPTRAAWAASARSAAVPIPSRSARCARARRTSTPKARTSSERRRATTCGSSPDESTRTVRVREVVEVRRRRHGRRRRADAARSGTAATAQARARQGRLRVERRAASDRRMRSCGF